MARWQPGARERLQAAALELFASRGFEQTTAAEIAQSVGLTERTFFRHFADKRDVLFHGQDELLRLFLEGVGAAPAGAAPLEVVGSALTHAAAYFSDERRSYSRARQSVIEQNPALQERERHKLASIATAIAQALRERGVAEPAASLAAESGATVFTIAFAQWIAPKQTRSLVDIASEVVGELQNLTRPPTSLRQRRSPNHERSRDTMTTKDDDASPAELIDRRIAELGDWRGERLAWVRELIKQADPDVVEEWKWRGVPVWSHAGMICTGETYKKIVKLTFAKGASLPDPSGLFNSSLEGNTRRAIDIAPDDTIDAKALQALVLAAVALNTSTARPRPAKRT